MTLITGNEIASLSKYLHVPKFSTENFQARGTIKILLERSHALPLTLLCFFSTFFLNKIAGISTLFAGVFNTAAKFRLFKPILEVILIFFVR